MLLKGFKASSQIYYQLPRLLCFELIQLSLLPVDLSPLRLKPSQYFSVLLLSRLHVVADQGTAKESDGAGVGAIIGSAQ